MQPLSKLKSLNQIPETPGAEENFRAGSDINSYLPLGINMAGMRCLIVGAGRIAARKAQTLLKAGATVTVLSCQIENDWLREQILDENISCIEAGYSSDCLTDCDLIIAATSNPELNAQIAREAENERKLCCVVSSARLSRIIFPAIHSHEGITVAVHSNGRDCRRSKNIRDNIAHYLKGDGKPVGQLLVFGFKRSDLPEHLSRSLKRFAHQASTENLGENVLVLSTCQRWECYISGKTPRDTIRTVISLLQQELNFDWDKYAYLAYFKHNCAAYHHLVRTISGLDSPLIAETEIVGQVRSAMSRYLSKADQHLAQVFDGAMLAARKLRSSCGLEPAQTSWAQVVISFIHQKINNRTSPKILVFGAGKLAKSIVKNCAEFGFQLEVLSNNADKVIEDELGEVKIPVQPPSEMAACMKKADAVVICTELASDSFDLCRLDPNKELLVLDMEGNNEFVDKSSNRICYYKAEDIVRNPLSVRQAATIAAAELKTMEQSLLWYSFHRKYSTCSDDLRIGARPSQLALAQVSEFVRMLKALSPQIKYHLDTIETPGDMDQETPLPQVVDDGFFTRDIDAALLAGRVDIAVHSAKDMPQKIHSGLCVAAVTPSIAPWECLVSRSGVPLMELLPGSVVGTSSQRRLDQLKRLRPDLIAADVRGNVPERLEQMDQGKYDALILASAGLIRLGMQQRITEIFNEEIFPFTPGQGSLAIVVRDSDKQLQELLRPLDLGSKEGLPWL